MATEFLIPSEDVTIRPARRTELIAKFYETFLDIMSEFHGINQVFHPDIEASDYTNNGNKVFENLLACQVDDMLNMFEAGFKADVNDPNVDMIYKIAYRKFHPDADPI